MEAKRERKEHVDAINGFKAVFKDEMPHWVSSAPGRVELLGNHVDYNGGYVMGMGIDRYVTCAISPTLDDRIEIHSDNASAPVLLSLENLHRLSAEERWANYVLGVYDEFLQMGFHSDYGFKMFITSNVPVGQGLSSSAALEVSVALAFSSLYGVKLTDAEIVKLCQRAENNFVGVPCGILDQMTSVFSKEYHLVLIDSFKGTVTREPIRESVNFWAFDSSTSHELMDSQYAKRFDECQRAAQLFDDELNRGRLLSHYNLEDLRLMENKLDPVLFKRASHVIEESRRVYDAKFDLHNGDLISFGNKLRDSHKSSRYQFCNSCDELDFLVDQLNGNEQVYGARLTGGGFGGAVVAMTNNIFNVEAADHVIAEFEKTFDKKSSYIQISPKSSYLVERLIS
jgi:galactokinase